MVKRVTIIVWDKTRLNSTRRLHLAMLYHRGPWVLCIYRNLLPTYLYIKWYRLRRLTKCFFYSTTTSSSDIIIHLNTVSGDGKNRSRCIGQEHKRYYFKFLSEYYEYCWLKLYGWINSDEIFFFKFLSATITTQPTLITVREDNFFLILYLLNEVWVGTCI